jgi:hypothetical protein
MSLHASMLTRGDDLVFEEDPILSETILASSLLMIKLRLF